MWVVVVFWHDLEKRRNRAGSRVFEHSSWGACLHHKNLQVELTVTFALSFALFPTLEERRVALKARVLFPSTAFDCLGNPALS
jgi:hypothetical protein